MRTRLGTALRQPVIRLARNPLIQRVVRNSGYLFGATTIAMALSMLQGALAARLLGVQGLGLLGLITEFSSNLNRLTSFRMGELVVTYVGKFRAEQAEAKAWATFKAAGLAEIGSSLLAFGLIELLAPLGARLIGHDPESSIWFRIYGLTVLANLMAESSTGLLQYYDRFRLMAGITVGQSVLTLGLMVAAFAFKAGLGGVVLAYLAGKIAWALATTLAALALARRMWGAGWWRAPFSLIADRWREMARFALSTNITTTLTLITRDSELLWLGAFTTPVQVGYYKIAKALSNILLTPVNPLISTTYREVARETAEKRWANVRYLLRSGSLISAAWTVPAGLGLLVLGPWIITLLYTSAFVPAYPSLALLILGVAAVNVLYWNRSVLLALGRPDFPTKVYSVAALLKMAGTVVLVPVLGAIGMAGLLSSFFLGTSMVLVWKTAAEIRRASGEPAPSAGG